MSKSDVEILRALSTKLETGRYETKLGFDMSTTAMWLTGFAEALAENSERTDYPGCAASYESMMDEVRAAYGCVLDDNADCFQLMAIGATLVEKARLRVPDPDGYLKSLPVVRKNFSFLEREFGFSVLREHICEVDYASPQAGIMLSVPPSGYAPLALKELSKPDLTFVLEDILFMAGQPVPLFPEQPPRVTTEAEAEGLFAGVATALRRHGADLLANKPGAFNRLAAAATERERRYVAECERLYGGNDHEVTGLAKAGPA